MAGNENRAHIEKSGVENRMTPCDGTGSAGAVSPGEMPPGILGKSMFTDPHQNQRGHHQNLTNKPREISPARHQSEARARIYDYGRTNSKSRT